jgi:hypothetical protein
MGWGISDRAETGGDVCTPSCTDFLEEGRQLKQHALHAEDGKHTSWKSNPAST